MDEIELKATLSIMAEHSLQTQPSIKKVMHFILALFEGITFSSSFFMFLFKNNRPKNIMATPIKRYQTIGSLKTKIATTNDMTTLTAVKGCKDEII